MIEVPVSTDTAAEGTEAIAAFKSAMTWLPAFARSVRHIEIRGDAPMEVVCSFSPLLDESEIRVVSISGRERERALHFDLSSGFCLLLRMGDAGPCALTFSKSSGWRSFSPAHSASSCPPATFSTTAAGEARMFAFYGKAAFLPEVGTHISTLMSLWLPQTV